jgi:hypothetical protein
MALTAILAAGLLLIGFLTPFAGSAAALGALGIWLSLLPACTPTLFDSKPSVVFALTIMLAIVALGPGAFPWTRACSDAARLFSLRQHRGRNEFHQLPPAGGDRSSTKSFARQAQGSIQDGH